MSENPKERAARQLAELERLQSEVLEAMKAANTAENLAANKREEMLRLDAEHSEHLKVASVAHRLVASKQDEFKSLLLTLFDEWRDKTKPLD